MAWIERVETWVPGWALRAKRRHWLALFTTIGATVDGLLNVIHEAALAAMPGMTEDPKSLLTFSSVDALDLLGRDRGVLRGLTEPSWSYAGGLRRFRAAWAGSGTVPELLEQLARVLGPNPPRLRIVNAGGVWWTREPDGTLIQQTTTGTGLRFNTDGTTAPDATIAPAWDWDSLSGNPPPPGWGDPTRFWVIVYAPCNVPYLAATSGTLGDGSLVGEGKGTPDAATLGTTSTIAHVELVRAVVQDWRAAGLRCSHVIIAFDPTSFNPDGSSAAYPDGTWGWPSKLVFLDLRLPARDLTARYWRAEPGGIAGT